MDQFFTRLGRDQADAWQRAALSAVPADEADEVTPGQPCDPATPFIEAPPSSTWQDLRRLGGVSIFGAIIGVNSYFASSLHIPDRAKWPLIALVIGTEILGGAVTFFTACPDLIHRQPR